METPAHHTVALAAALAAFAAFIAGGAFSYAVVADEFKQEYRAREERVLACLDGIVAQFNNRKTMFDLSWIDYRYNPAVGLCLYAGNYVGGIDGGTYFEKFLVNAYTGAPIAKYAELDGKPTTTDLDGRPIRHTLESFNATVDALFAPTDYPIFYNVVP